MGKHGFVKVGVLLVVSVLALTVVVQTANAAIGLENVKTWLWGEGTHIKSVAVCDVDGDGKTEIVTGGYYYDDAFHTVAQLCVWTEASLALENVKTWQWTSFTEIWSVAVGDVDGDGKTEIVTGGYYYDGTRDIAQLCVWQMVLIWPGIFAISLENVRTWYWTDDTYIESVAVGDVDGDGQVEIVTGGYCPGSTCYVAQLCVWDGATLALEDVKTWYWTSNTVINSVAVGDVDGDGKTEIATGGCYWQSSYTQIAQLCVWDGATIALENVRTWLWGDDTTIKSVAVGDVDGDGVVEIVTGGHFVGIELYTAQLCVWYGWNLALKAYAVWEGNHYAYLWSVAVGDVDCDGDVEIVTGGSVFGDTCNVAQLCVWRSPVWGTYSMTLEDVKTWNWGITLIESVAVGNVDNKRRIVTGGRCDLLTAQLCTWDVGGAIL